MFDWMPYRLCDVAAVLVAGIAEILFVVFIVTAVWGILWVK